MYDDNEVDGEINYTIHVIPNDDFTHEGSAFCPCDPALTDDDQLSEPDEDGERHILVSYQHTIMAGTP